ncbi:MAG: VTT domain-containing protein [Pseudomonadota bacterium]
MFDAATIESLIAFGVLAALFLALTERILLFVPSYVLFIGMGSILVNDWYDLMVVTLFSAIGSTIGAMLWFWGGKWLGPARCRAWVARYQRWLFFSVERYDSLAKRFEQSAWKVVLIAQTIPTIRIFIALPAGILGIPTRTFAIATFIGCLIWNGGLILGGVLLQMTDWPAPLMIAAIIGSILAIEGLILLIAWLGPRWRMSCQP